MKRNASIIAAALAWLIVILVIAFIAWLAIGWLAPSVKVIRAVSGPVIRAAYATGTISPEREYPIRASSAGMLDKIAVDKGSAVTAGQSLGRISEPALTLDVERARADLVEKLARADDAASPVLAEFDARIAAGSEQLAIARREEARQRTNVERGGGSVTDVDRAADRTQAALALVEATRSARAAKLLELQRDAAVARSALDAAEANLARLALASPIDGVVLDRPTSPGTRVAVNDVLMRIADVRPERLVMRAAVDEEDITHVRVGQKVVMTLYAFAGTHFVGKVKTIYAEADANRRTFEVDVAIDVPSDRFQPGMTGELAFVIEERTDATILPSHAVQGDAVYAVRDGRVRRLDATIGIRAVDRVEVLGGVSPDDRVIVSTVTPGMVDGRARTEEVDPRAAAGLGQEDSSGAQFKGFRN